MASESKVKVLVVEDNPADQFRVREALDAGGKGRFDPTFAGGLGAARSRLPGIDLVLLDLNLPDSAGADTVARVREAAPSTPVVVLSGERDDATTAACLQHGAQDVLLKGAFDGDSLVRALTCALERQALARRRDAAAAPVPGPVMEQEVREATSRLAAGVARSLADPLAAVLHGAFALSDGHDAAAFGPALMIQRAGWQASALAKQLAACAGEAKANPEAVDVNALLSGERDEVLETARGAVTVEWNLEPDLPRVRIDRRLLDLALQILARHALGSMPEGGTLRMGTRRTPSGFVEVSVADSGPGLDPDQCRRIFEPFFTTEVLGIGTGLGLAPVLGIAHQWGGSAAAESEPGRGTTVRILLPPIEEEPVAPVAPVAAVAAEPKGPDPVPGNVFAPPASPRPTTVRHYLTMGCEFID